MSPLLRIFTALFLLTNFAACGNDAATLKSEENEASTTTNYAANAQDPGIVNVNKQLKEQPENASLYATRAELWYAKDNFDNAIADLQIALSIDSSNLNYHYLLSDVYLDYFQSRLALRTMERAVALDPDNVGSLLSLAEVKLILKQYDEAVTTLNEVTRVAPRNPDAYLLLGQVFAETGDTSRAINATQEAVEIDPDLMDGWITLGQLHAAINGPLAGRFFDTAIQLDPNDVVAVHAKADYLRDQGQLNEAIKLYKRCSEIDRQYVAGNFNASLLYLEQDSVEQARQQLNIVIGNDPIHIRGYFFRGYTYEMEGDLAAAKKDYEVSLRFAPDYELALQGLARVESNLNENEN